MNDAASPATLGARAARGTAYLFAGQLGSQILRLGSNLILTRLLIPEAFGLMAIVLAVTTGLQLISDVGIWTSIVRSPRGDERDYQDTAWTLSLLRGVGLFAIGCAAAWPASLFYGRAELLWLLPIVTFQAVVGGIESTKSAVANRNLEVGRLITMEVVSQAVALCVSLPVAWYTRSVVALVAASMAAVVTRTLMSHFFIPGPRNRLRWEPSSLKEILSFGSWIFVSTLLFFAGTRWDVFALGRLEGMTLLGVYGLAQMITAVPSQIGERVTGFVLMPALAERFRAAPAELANDVKTARGILLPAAAVLFLGAAMTAPAFFHALYLDAYRDAGWMTQLLVLAAWCAFLQESSTRALQALGDSRSMAAANLVRLLVTIAGTAVGFELASLVGFIIGGAFGSLAGALFVNYALWKHGVNVMLLDLAATAVFIVIGLVGCGVPHLLADVVGVRAEYLTLGSVVVILGPIAAVVALRTRAAIRRSRSA